MVTAPAGPLLTAKEHTPVPTHSIWDRSCPEEEAATSCGRDVLVLRGPSFPERTCTVCKRCHNAVAPHNRNTDRCSSLAPPRKAARFPHRSPHRCRRYPMPHRSLRQVRLRSRYRPPRRLRYSCSLYPAETVRSAAGHTADTGRLQTGIDRTACPVQGVPAHLVHSALSRTRL